MLKTSYVRRYNPSFSLNDISKKIVNEMKDIVKKFGDSPVLLVGDVMLDRFIYGQAQRLSPEGPIPVLSISRENEMLGGAGNVLANMQALGCQCDMIAVRGADEAGDKIKSLIGRQTGLIVDSSRPTILKTRYIAQNQQLLRVDHEKTIAVSQAIQKEILEKAATFIKNKKILVLSDYGKGVLTDSLTRSLIQLAQDNNVIVLVDPKGKDFSKYNGATIVTPNKKELSDATGGAAVISNNDIESAARGLMKDNNIETVIATRSEDGMSVIAQDSAHHISTKAREVFDVSGAGDSVVATIAAALGAGASLHQAAELANIAGGLAVAKIGTAIIQQSELQNALQDNAAHNASFISPILSESAAQNQIQKWQAQGLKVGLTNGCFDILHYGHVHYLARARERCDRLVIALNHDASIKILKGEARPVNNQDARAAVIAALGSCNMVVLFGAEKSGEDNTPSALIDMLQPDIFFKGGDYTIDALPEGKIVLGYGGKVDIMPLYEGYSTTNIINAAQE